MDNNFPYLGFGLGLRREHYQTVLDSKPDIDWFEILSENYMVPGGKPLDFATRIREHYPMVMHGVAMSIGSASALNMDYLKQLKNLAQRIQPSWISDHLCWTGVNGSNTHDLLPLPYTEEAISHVVSRVNQVQDYLGREILLENVSSYVSFKQSDMPEWEFLSQVCQQSGCYLLLDINNIYVSSFNHEFDPLTYLNHIPVNKVKQFHLAGHTNCDTYIIDTHDEPVIDEVWSLYQQAVKRFGKVSTMIERDDNIPPLQTLIDELDVAKNIAEKITASKPSLEVAL